MARDPELYYPTDASEQDLAVLALEGVRPNPPLWGCHGEEYPELEASDV
jgi:hypothetical protein